MVVQKKPHRQPGRVGRQPQDVKIHIRIQERFLISNRLPLAEILYHGVQLTLVVRRSAAKYSPVEDAGVFRISVFGPKKYSGIANAASVFRTGN